MLLRIGVKSPVLCCCTDLRDTFVEAARTFREKGVGKKLPHIIYGHFGGMHHIGGIEAVITEIIEQQFVGWKIIRVIQLAANRLAGQYERGFTALVFHQSIAEVPDRADR